MKFDARKHLEKHIVRIESSLKQIVIILNKVLIANEPKSKSTKKTKKKSKKSKK